MAKMSIINRNIKRKALVLKYTKKRQELFSVIRDFAASTEAKDKARIVLQSLPRNSSPVRVRNRCSLTGRPRGVYSKFGLGRCKLREIAMTGNIPGIVKASW